MDGCRGVVLCGLFGVVGVKYVGVGEGWIVKIFRLWGFGEGFWFGRGRCGLAFWGKL